MIFKTPDNATICVKKSPLHGKGLFTQDFIPEGAILGTIKGIRTSKNGMYTLWVDEHRPVRMLCKFKYINHSDDPNVVLYDTLEVCAVKDIHPGEEILHDYESGDWEEDEEYEDDFTHVF